MLTTTLLFLQAASAAAAHLQLSLSRPQQPHNATVARHKRQVGADLKRPIDLYNSYYPYAVDVAVGTPGQAQSLALTFSHPASFVLNQSICLTPEDEARGWYYDNYCGSGAYDASESSSYERSRVELSDYDLYLQEGNEFYDVYGSRLVSGSRMTETVHVGGAEVNSVRLGLANETMLPTGFMGLGYSYDSGDQSFLNQMTDQGVIESRAFSLWAEDQGNNVAGNILFGAVDKSKYNGTLQRLQASAYRDGPFYSAPGFAVNVTAAENQDGNSLTSNFSNFYASVSPTTMITNLPLELAEPIWEMANASYRGHWDGRAVDCNATDTFNGSFTLELGGAGGYRLEVNVRDLVLSPETWWEKEAWNLDEDREAITWCFFGVQSTNQTHEFNHDSIQPWVIGNMALKDSYMVFDVENMEVGLAPLKSDLNGDADITAFTHSGETMPDSEFVGYQECFSSYGCDDDSDGGGSSGDYDDDSSNGGHDGLWLTAVIVASVAGVIALVVIGLSIWAILRCRRIRKAEAEAALRGPVPTVGPAMSGVPVAAPWQPYPTNTQRLPVVPEEGLPQDATRQTVEPVSATAEDSPAQTVSPMSTPRAPEATLAREPPATMSNQGEK